MLRSNRGDYIDDHQNARLTQAGAAGFGCFHNLLWTLTVPSFTVEVFLRTRMGWIYVLINTIWGSLFLALCVLVTKLEDPSILVFALLFWAAALVRLVSFFAIREQIHAYSCGMPLRLWSRIVGTGAAAQPLTLILGEPILVGCVGQLLSVFGLRATGALLVMASMALLLKNLSLIVGWGFRRQQATDSRIAGEAMQGLNRPPAQIGARGYHPQFARFTPPPGPPP